MEDINPPFFPTPDSCWYSLIVTPSRDGDAEYRVLPTPSIVGQSGAIAQHLLLKGAPLSTGSLRLVTCDKRL